jgi:hypothetical protein
VLNQKFVSGIIDDPEIAQAIQDISQMQNATPEEIQARAQALEPLAQNLKQRIQDQALEEGLNTSIGGHVLVGMRAKLPIIPIAAYTNFKYYFGGDYPKEVDAGNMTLEVGVGLAI